MAAAESPAWIAIVQRWFRPVSACRRPPDRRFAATDAGSSVPRTPNAGAASRLRALPDPAAPSSAWPTPI